MTDTFSEIAAIRPHAVWPGVLGRVVSGDKITFAVVELSPDAVVSQHAHPNEQIGLVLKGSLTFTIGGERRELGVGETYVIRGGVPHDAVAGPDGATVVDVFSPLREDWEALERLEASKPAWP